MAKKQTSEATAASKQRGKAARVAASEATAPEATTPVSSATPKRSTRKANRVEATAEPAALETTGATAAPPPAPKRSALESAVQVLREAGRPMSCGELITAMAAKDYWTSPAGKTPAATLYASILKEITTKGTDARFVKVTRGQFALRESAR